MLLHGNPRQGVMMAHQPGDFFHKGDRQIKFLQKFLSHGDSLPFLVGALGMAVGFQAVGNGDVVEDGCHFQKIPFFSCGKLLLPQGFGIGIHF